MRIRPFRLNPGLMLFFCAFLFGEACHSVAPTTRPAVQHLALISRPGEALYIDRVSNSTVMKERNDGSAKTSFCSFLVGWQDSTINAASEDSRDREKYFQYDMQKDWVALVKGDSVYPVFFQERPTLGQQCKESVLVFELPRGSVTDTLVYKHGYGSWGTRLFVLNEKSLRRHVQD